MSRMIIEGIGIEYDLLGPPGGPAIALTPGGRFARDTPGLPQLAEALAAGGRRVLLWDRPNCGGSDLCFAAKTESGLHGRVLTQLIRALELGPTALAAGSAGSRVSLIAASRDPEIVSHLILWWISGGPIGSMQLVPIYCGDPAFLASVGGMKAVVDGEVFAEQIRRNPRNRDILLAQDPDVFIETLQQWAAAYAYSEISPVPGMSPSDFAQLRMPTLIYRSGKSDLSHTRRTSEWVHELIGHSELIEPPWPDQEWNNRVAAMRQGRGLFEHWPDLAPGILEFTSR
jgi:pimeloyl-ACP methyl ester carboxylesterase